MILPVLSKIIKTAVHHQLYTYIKEKTFFASEKFGFYPNLSTEVALAHLTENILDIKYGTVALVHVQELCSLSLALDIWYG